MLLFCLVWVCCILSSNNGSPLSEKKTALAETSYNFYGETEKSFPEERRLREKRYLWNMAPSLPMFFQNIGKTFTDALGRMQPTMPTMSMNGTMSDTLAQMMNDFRTKLAPDVILRSLYTTVVQNVFKQIRDQARSTFNHIFDSMAVSR